MSSSILDIVSDITVHETLQPVTCSWTGHSSFSCSVFRARLAAVLQRTNRSLFYWDTQSDAQFSCCIDCICCVVSCVITGLCFCPSFPFHHRLSALQRDANVCGRACRVTRSISAHVNRKLSVVLQVRVRGYSSKSSTWCGKDSSLCLFWSVIWRGYCYFIDILKTLQQL